MNRLWDSVPKLFLPLGITAFLLSIVVRFLSSVSPFLELLYTHFFAYLAPVGILLMLASLFLHAFKKIGEDTEEERDMIHFLERAIIAGLILWIPLSVGMTFFLSDFNERTFSEGAVYAVIFIAFALAFPIALGSLIGGRRFKKIDTKRAIRILQIPFYNLAILLIALFLLPTMFRVLF